MTLKHHNKAFIETGIFKSVDYTKNYVRDCMLDLKENGYTYVNSQEKLNSLLKICKYEVVIEKHTDNYWLVKKV